MLKKSLFSFFKKKTRLILSSRQIRQNSSFNLNEEYFDISEKEHEHSFAQKKLPSRKNVPRDFKIQETMKMFESLSDPEKIITSEEMDSNLKIFLNFSYSVDSVEGETYFQKFTQSEMKDLALKISHVADFAFKKKMRITFMTAMKILNESLLLRKFSALYLEINNICFDSTENKYYKIQFMRLSLQPLKKTTNLASQKLEIQTLITKYLDFIHLNYKNFQTDISYESENINTTISLFLSILEKYKFFNDPAKIKDILNYLLNLHNIRAEAVLFKFMALYRFSKKFKTDLKLENEKTIALIHETIAGVFPEKVIKKTDSMTFETLEVIFPIFIQCFLILNFDKIREKLFWFGEIAENIITNELTEEYQRFGVNFLTNMDKNPSDISYLESMDLCRGMTILRECQGSTKAKLNAIRLCERWAAGFSNDRQIQNLNSLKEFATIINPNLKNKTVEMRVVDLTEEEKNRVIRFYKQAQDRITNCKNMSPKDMFKCVSLIGLYYKTKTRDEILNSGLQKFINNFCKSEQNLSDRMIMENGLQTIHFYMPGLDNREIMSIFLLLLSRYIVNFQFANNHIKRPIFDRLELFKKLSHELVNSSDPDAKLFIKNVDEVMAKIKSEITNENN